MASPWWSRPIARPAARSADRVADADGWCRSPIDRFVLARLKASGLGVSADADRRTLIRRAYFAVLGLPPSTAAIDQFLSDSSQDAFERLIERLLASPRFGERWGRHWLDVARYADSTGGGRSMLYGNAWRYRDYVITAFNHDKPFDTFLVEQLAGDLLDYTDPEVGRQQLTATAFLALGPTNYELQDKEQLRMDVIDEQIDTVGRVMLGLSLGCARCHDHKFDPVSTREYYALAGVFRSTQTLIHDNVSTWVKRPVPVDAQWQQRLDAHQQAVAELVAQLVACQELRDEDHDLEQRQLELSQELAQLRSAPPPPPPHVMAVAEEQQVGDHFVCVRGNVHESGDAVPRGVIDAVGGEHASQIPEAASGRLELARWIASSNNPLTARVMINRIWHHLFGAGLVRTVDNFGARGETPSHPELLDYLAARFVEQGWSVKAIIREIMLSHTYRLSSVALPEAARRDPENRLLSRFPRRRLDAEALHDAMLVLSGRLDSRMGGDTIRTDTKIGIWLPVRVWAASRVPASVPQPPGRCADRVRLPRSESGDGAAGREYDLDAGITDDERPVRARSGGRRGGTVVARVSARHQRGAARRAVSASDGRPSCRGGTRIGPGIPGIRRRGSESGPARGMERPLPGRDRVCAFPIYSVARPRMIARRDRFAGAGPLESPCCMRPEHHYPQTASRRELLRGAACGFGSLALAGLAAARPAVADAATTRLDFDNPLAAVPAMFPARARRIIFIFMQGGPSQVDTFDYKPALEKYHGQKLPFRDSRKLAKTGMSGAETVMKSLWKFRRYGECGQFVSDLFPEIARHVDDLCFLHSLHTNGVAHGPSTLFLHTGATNLVRPSMGAWVTYGLGTENDNLPGFVTIGPSSANGGPRNYASAFLPAHYQGTPIGSAAQPGRNLNFRHVAGSELPVATRRRQFELLQQINARQRERLSGVDRVDEVEALISSYELAWRMQTHAPEALDISRETTTTQTMYGIGEKETDAFGRQCLVARRMAEAGVRFIQVNYADNGNNPRWDQHSKIQQHAIHARASDKPVAGLLADLKSRGLLEDTLVWWGGEFGRNPFAQGADGRDHNPQGFTHFLAGGGVKTGFAYGKTDEFGHRAVENRVHMHDLHATILHLLGLDHTRLTYRFAGRDFRLTDVEGQVVEGIVNV